MRVADNRTLGMALLRSGTALCVFLASCGPAILPGSPETVNREIVLQADRYDRAISEFNRVLEKNPRDARAYYERGLVYYNMGEYDKASQDVRRAQSLGYQVPPEFLKLLSEGLSENR
jgi:tetratricopeptide (TPR) repeat protein